MALFTNAPSERTEMLGAVRTFVRIYGQNKKGIPLLLANGGPGASHDYLLPLKALAKHRPVIFYDQIGCGKSDGRDDESLWQVEPFVEQLAALRATVDGPIHLFGHSWGGMLTLEYMKTNPPHIGSLTLASTMHDVPMYMKEVDRLLEAMGPGTRAIARQNENRGTLGSSEYRNIMASWDRTHLWHGTKPTGTESTGGFNGAMYTKMWGPTEFCVSGTLKNWSAAQWMPELDLPTLVIAGEYDEVTPALVESCAALLPHAHTKVVPGGAHLVHMENSKTYLKELNTFISTSEK